MGCCILAMGSYVACSINSLFFINLNFLPPGEIFHAFLSVAEFFQNHFFQKILSGIPSEYETDLIRIRPDILSGLIWVQPVCKGYQQTTLVGNELTHCSLGRIKI